MASTAAEERLPAAVTGNPRWLLRLAARRWLDALAPRRWLVVSLAIGLASRLAVLAVGYVGLPLVPDNPAFVRATYSNHPFLDRWYEWDASWYAAIATRGYQAAGDMAPSVAFWPLLPLLESVFGRPLLLLFTGMHPAEAVAWAGMAVVFVAFLVGCVLLYHVVLEDHGPDVARRTVTCLAFAPGAVYYTAVYPAALLLVGVAGCFWALRQERWAMAGLAGLWAALAQVPGCLLVFPFAWEYARRRRGRIGLSSLWVLLIPLGPALWLAYLWTLTGDLLAPVTAAYNLWPHHSAWPWETFVAHARAVLSNPTHFALGLLNLATALTALGASAWALRAGHASWGIWGLAVMALYLSVPAAEPFEGIVRYSLPVLPLWLLLARLARRPLVEAATIGTLGMFLGLLTVLYLNSFWVA
ncbi:MAG: hypothetical protein HY690_20630 [Chloroflexi bacterium]|nr:hypothetical protein [Chloroflexota bacterium]